MLDLTSCNICPRNCNVDRTKQVGYCAAGEEMSVSKIMLHHWEEPCISGDSSSVRGSGTIFFTHCSLGCVYCQNSKISRKNSDETIYTPLQLANEMLKLEADGAYNINLVSPTHYTPQIIESVKLARNKGLSLPIVWNTGGYEKPETIEALSGTVDIFLTDFKYSDPNLAKLYSSAENYPEFAISSLRKMLEIIGECTFDDDGMMQKGVIVRHLVLPSHREDSINVLRIIAKAIDITKIRLSLMAQYTPEFLPMTNSHDNFAKIRRKITTFEYEKVANEALRLGFEGYMQERSSATKRFTPDF